MRKIKNRKSSSARETTTTCTHEKSVQENNRSFKLTNWFFNKVYSILSTYQPNTYKWGFPNRDDKSRHMYLIFVVISSNAGPFNICMLSIVASRSYISFLPSEPECDFEYQVCSAWIGQCSPNLDQVLSDSNKAFKIVNRTNVLMGPVSYSRTGKCSVKWSSRSFGINFGAAYNCSK